jgi:signal-transduction protein with cAMP-binding, CBS, and nucleotidyltransferase domain
VLEDIHYNLKLINYEEGTSVIMKGTIADSIIFIVSGVLELYVEGGINDY